MMNNKIINEQKHSWDSMAELWGRKWNDFIMDWHNPIGDKIIEMAQLKPGDSVLDVATGAGEPGLSAASKVINGKVTGLDISEQMVKLANETAKKSGQNNYSAMLYEGEHIPFEDETFDAVISRNGVIFFPDVEKGLKEFHRVLKPGGRAVISGWGLPNEKSNSGAIVQKILREVLNIPPPAPDAPGSFRLGPDGICKSVLNNSGFRNTKEVDLFGKVTFPSEEGYWNFISEMQIPIRTALAEKDESFREEMKSFVMNEVKPFIKNNHVEFMWHAKLGFGLK